MRLRYACGLVALTVLLSLIWLAVFAQAPVLAGWHPLVVGSDSMVPAFRRGDVVVVAPPPSGSLEPGTVVAFDDPARPGIMVHRIVGSNGESYVTKGDANGAPDSTPIAPQGVRGVGRLVVPLVGWPILAWSTSNVGLLAAMAVGLAALVWASRWAVLPGFEHGARPASHLKRPRRPATALMTAVALSLAALIQPARASFSDTTVNSANSVAAASSFATTYYYLHDFPTPPVGDTTSLLVLPMDTTVPSASTLYNYDIDRDAFAGLLLTKSAMGLSETDPKKHQLWSLTTSSSLSLQGSAAVTLWSSMRNFDVSQGGELLVALYDCDAVGLLCTAIATGSLNVTPWNSGSSWTARVVSLGTVNHTVAALRTLRLKAVVGANSDDDMWFAYDTISFQSRLEITP